MNRATAVIRIITWSAVALVALCILLGVLLGNSFLSGIIGEREASEMSGDATVLTDASYSPDGIHSVFIQGRSENVHILPSADGQFRVYETFRRVGFGGDPEPVSVSVENGVFSVGKSSRGGIWVMFGWTEHKIDIYVPQTHWTKFTAKLSSGNMTAGTLTADDITLECTSGNLEMNALDATNTLDAHITSGKITLNDAQSREADIRASSGLITLDTLNADTLNVEVSSGIISGRRIDAGVLTTRTSSGSIKLEGSFSDITSRVTSGISDIESAVTPQSLSGDVTSGSLTFRLPEDSVFSLDYRLTSGSIRSEFGHQISGRSGQAGREGPVYNAEIASGSLKFAER